MYLGDLQRLSIIGTLRGKLWVHKWNISVADVASKDFQIVSCDIAYESSHPR